MKVQAVQGLFGETSLPFWKAVTFLGDGSFVFVVFAVFAWVGSTARAVQIGIVGVVIGVLVGFLKVAVREPRPYLIDPTIVPWEASGGFGMPSGHSASVTGLFALLWLYRRNVWVLCLAVAAILLVGLSRLYLGVHTAEQVVAGWGLGLVVVAIVHRFGSAIGDVLFRPNLRVQIALATFCCLALALAQNALAVRLSADFVIPTEWVEHMQTARALAGLPADARRLTTTDLFELHRIYLPALLLGMWLSAIIARTGWSVERFAPSERVLNLLIGLPVLLVAIATIVLTREIPTLPFVLICATPAAVAIGVPWLTRKALVGVL